MAPSTVRSARLFQIRYLFFQKYIFEFTPYDRICGSWFPTIYPLINRKSALKTKCTILIYQSILRPLMTYGCVIWGTTSKTNLKKVQTFQNRILRISVNAPWYVKNSQIHRELGISPVEDFIKKCAKNFFKNISLCSSAVHLQLGQKTQNNRLKKRLPQDVLISNSDSEWKLTNMIII